MIDIFAKGDKRVYSWQIAESVFIDALHQQYTKESGFSLEDVVEQAKEDIRNGIENGGLTITPKKKEIIDNAVNSLIETYRQVVRMRYGLEDNNPRTWKYISAQIGASQWKATHIGKIVLRLKFRYAAGGLNYVRGLVTDEVINLRAEEYSIKEARRAEEYSIKEARDSAIRLADEAERKRNAPNLSVDELELSIRSYNCLKNANIRTIGELTEKTEEEMLKTKNFGRRSLNELREALAELGLSFKKSLHSPETKTSQIESLSQLESSEGLLNFGN